MIVASEHQAKLRQKEIQEIDKKASKEHEEAKKNSNFTQTYPKGWQRIRELVRDKQGAAAIGLYSFFAEHIDPTCGAVVCDQQFLANQMGVSTEQFSSLVRLFGGERCFGKNTSCWKGLCLRFRSSRSLEGI